MKNFGKLFLAVASVMIFTMQVNAQKSNASANQPAKQQSGVNSTSVNFVDKDNDGICDNFATRSGKGRGGNFVDKDNNGICDNFVAGSGKGRGGNFVDKNKDGVCDNFATRSGKGRGGNFVDKNNDGICDNLGNAGKKSGNQYRNGPGNQHRQGQGQGRGCGNYCRR